MIAGPGERQSIAAFCRDEAVSTASFHIWGAKLATPDGHGAKRTQPVAFIDLGAIKEAVGVRSIGHAETSAPVPISGIDVRIDLDGGVVLTITRR